MERAEEALAHMGSSVSYILHIEFTTGSEVNTLNCGIVKNNILHAGNKKKWQDGDKYNKLYTSTSNVNIWFIR